MADPAIPKFVSMYNRCVRRLLGLPHMTHTRLLPLFTCRPPALETLNSLCGKIILNMLGSPNGNVSFIAERSVYDSGSILSSNLGTISALEPYMPLIEEEGVAQAVVELRHSRPEGLTPGEAEQLITMLCTS